MLCPHPGKKELRVILAVPYRIRSHRGEVERQHVGTGPGLENSVVAASVDEPVPVPIRGSKQSGWRQRMRQTGARVETLGEPQVAQVVLVIVMGGSVQSEPEAQGPAERSAPPGRCRSAGADSTTC